MNLTIEEKLYLLKEMKERSNENAAHLHKIPDYKNNFDSSFQKSYYNDNYEDEFGKKIVTLSVKIKFFIFRCVFCTLIFLGLYYTSLQKNNDTAKNISALSNALREDSVSSELKNKLQNKIISYIGDFEK